MRTFLKGVAIAIAAMALLVIVAVPFAVPPLVKALAEDKLAALGFLATVEMDLGYGWCHGPSVDGALSMTVRESPWHVAATFGASFGEWHARVEMPSAAFTETDPTIAKLLADYPVDAVSNLVFSGNIALEAAVDRTRKMPVPVWSVKVPVTDVSVSLVAGEKPIAVDGFSVTLGASGIADHVDIAPMFPRAKAIEAAGFSLADFHASVRATEKMLMVNEASANFCGGKVNLYSVFLDPKNLNTGFTLFIDDINAGQALSHFSKFNGTASGHLHGKVKMSVRKGGEAVRFSDAFLYSTPGEKGNLHLVDPAPVTDNLALAGMDEASRRNVADALTDLDYSVLKLNLTRKDGNHVALNACIEGTATRNGLTVPVTLDLTVNGELEQLVNFGLNAPTKLKGLSK